MSVTEAARNFAELVNRAFYRHETTVLLKNGVAVAHIAPGEPEGIPAGSARARLRDIPKLASDEAEAFARDVEVARASVPALTSPWD